MLKIEAVDYSEVLLYLCQPGWHHAIKRWIFPSYWIENLKLYRVGKAEHTWAFRFLSEQVLVTDARRFILYVLRMVLTPKSD